MKKKGVLNPLPPTLRERNRYLAFKVEGSRSFGSEEVGRSIWAVSLRFLGELGVSKTSLRIIEFDEKKQKGIVKCTHKTVAEVRAAIAVISEIEKTKAAVRVIGVSGTIKKAKKEYIK
ncbi:MAG: Rpp14/Pop5 family protein [Candidatus Altiarchaeota archaeon]